MRPLAVLREGVGKYLARLFRLGPELLGITGWVDRSIAVVETSTLRVVKQLRIRSPDLVLPTSAVDRVWLLSFHAGEGRVLDLTSLRLHDAIPLLVGTAPIPLQDGIFLLAGHRRPVQGVNFDDVWVVEVSRPVLVDSTKFSIRNEGPRMDRLPWEPRWEGVPFRGSGATAAVDVEGRVVIQTSRGIAVFDPRRLDLLGEWHEPCWRIAYVPTAHCAVVMPDRFELTELKVVRWSAA
jgi:hypothetical protein